MEIKVIQFFCLFMSFVLMIKQWEEYEKTRTKSDKYMMYALDATFFITFIATIIRYIF
ncbi:hypothetical protein KG089_05330 [Carnobacteriaceae bacterium zg-ZUI252]|nr:hypothetical protein [Carnobacteriaceae bacterium zg-ZUI252]